MGNNFTTETYSAMNRPSLSISETLYSMEDIYLSGELPDKEIFDYIEKINTGSSTKSSKKLYIIDDDSYTNRFSVLNAHWAMAVEASNDVVASILLMYEYFIYTGRKYHEIMLDAYEVEDFKDKKYTIDKLVEELAKLVSIHSRSTDEKIRIYIRSEAKYKEINPVTINVWDLRKIRNVVLGY